MGAGEPACAEDAEGDAVFASEMSGGSGRCRGRAERGEMIGRDGENGFGSCGIEKQISGVNSIFALRRTVANCDQLDPKRELDRIEARHRQEDAAVDRKLLPRGDGDPGKASAKSILDAGDEVWSAQVAKDIGFGEVQAASACHGIGVECRP